MSWMLHPRVSKGSIAPLLAVIGGGAIAVGAWLPWMSYFAGLYPLRGVIELNGRLMLAAGVAGVISGVVLMLIRATRSRRFARRGVGTLGGLVVVAAVWLLVGVRELTRVHTSNAMLAPKPGIGLLVVLLGGLLLALVSIAPDSAAA